jgi:uncharacterized LabA/DUF88 family protein
VAKVAFIDVQNTETTVQKWLGFSIEWSKLVSFLRDDWHCEHIYFYLGIQQGDTSRAQEFNNLKGADVTVRPKYYYVHKVSDKTVNTTCPVCANKITVKVDMGYTWKCNCDVELTADVLEHAQPGVEMYLFSGDGDFEFLIDKILSKGTSLVSIVSTSKPRVIAGRSDYRLSKKLKTMTRNKPVNILEIDNIKKKIESGAVISTL